MTKRTSKAPYPSLMPETTWDEIWDDCKPLTTIEPVPGVRVQAEFTPAHDAMVRRLPTWEGGVDTLTLDDEEAILIPRVIWDAIRKIDFPPKG